MHGYAAYRLGDPTAKDAGRLTLNPLKHIDPFGTVLLPLLLAFTGGPIFGYAKPVPVNPRNFADIRKGDLITGIAGPAANLALALVGAAVAWIVVIVPLPRDVAAWTFLVASLLVRTNLVLMFFNLLPIPPLDGSSIVPIFLPDSALPGWYRFQQYSFALLLLLLWVIPSMTSFNPLGAYFGFTIDPVMNLLLPN